MRSSVVFPEPLRPAIIITRPLGSRNETPLSAHRRRIALALGRIGPHAFVDINGNGERDPNERQVGVDDLAFLANDRDISVRVTTAFALGQIGDIRATDTLLQLATDRESADVAA